MKVISDGKAICIEAPRTKHGLEGYNLEEEYKFKRCVDNKGEYIRMYPSAYDDNFANNYYETLTERIFIKYFKVIGEKSHGR